MLAHQARKGQLLSICIAETISPKFYHLDGKIRVEEIGQPHSDVLKAPDAIGLRHQALNHNQDLDEKLE